MVKKNSAKTSKANSVKGISFIIIVGDEGAVLVQVQRGKVLKRWFAATPDPAHTRTMDEVLNAFPKAPITIIIDMMDQSYIQQTLPPISSLSVGKIIRRRMEKDFAPTDIKGYIILGRQKEGRKDWNYLMVSVVNPPLLQRWISFVLERPNPFRGMGLLPLESQKFLLALDSRLNQSEPKSKDHTEWQVLVSHQKIGGFRQIVLRNGKLVFTRMAQPVGESLPEVIAGNIEQELSNTLEYLKRMGLEDLSALSVIIIASEEIGSFIEPARLNAQHYNFLTPFEVARLLSLKDAAQPQDQFGDVVLAAYIAAQRKITLSLQIPYSQKLFKLSVSIQALKVVCALTALAIIGWAGQSAYDIYNLQEEIDKTVTQHASLKSQLDKIKLQTKSLPEQIDLFSDIVNTVTYMDKRVYSSLNFIQKLSGTFGNAGIITNFHWLLTNPLSLPKGNEKNYIAVEAEVRLTSPKEPKKEYISAAQSLMDRLQSAFPTFEMTHSDLPGLVSDVQVFKAVIGSGENGIDTAGGAAQIDSVKITYKGPLVVEGTQNGH